MKLYFDFSIVIRDFYPVYEVVPIGDAVIQSGFEITEDFIEIRAAE